MGQDYTLSINLYLRGTGGPRSAERAGLRCNKGLLGS